MKKIILPFLFLILCFVSCKDQRIRKTPPVPRSATDLVTGCYYIVQDSTMLKREVMNNSVIESYFIDPKPILTVANFNEVIVSENNGFPTLTVRLDKPGTLQWSIATEKCIGKQLAFIINNKLVMAPTVSGKIESGKFEISGNFKKEELNDFMNAIHRDMYEDKSK